ncbi:hypothetical protein [Metapseudomonas resinovorans]|uniref:Secreted protein n=1 Tax=Metapseudomonas resinovorans NBRC 106553 TaxID=1245471 RepID=S6AXX0_METRE|nr:hypothetical protein [Pseudomonas resinovorans]BAN51363.1 hypothetical protein PCA10_56310 [Pseudomonas resinovorans NBRC 106553]
MKATQLTLAILMGLGASVALAEGGSERSTQMVTEFRESQAQIHEKEMVAEQDETSDVQADNSKG